MYQALFVKPIYNLFVVILGVIPGANVGVAIALLTLFIRLILYPLFASSTRTQMAMQAVRPEMSEISEKFKDDPMEMRRQQAELFKRHNIKMFSVFGVMIIQLLVLFSLSGVFRAGFLTVKTDLLYSFVRVPAHVSDVFLGFIQLSHSHNAFLAIIVSLLQFVASYLAFARLRTMTATAHLSKQQQKQQDLQNKAMLYLFPLGMLLFTFFVTSGVGVYFAFSSIASILQELLIRRKPL